MVYCAKERQAEVKDFITECNRTLPLYKRISAVEFTAEPLPRNALGKLLRKESRDLDAAKKNNCKRPRRAVAIPCQNRYY